MSEVKREAYESPLVRKVSLAADELAAVACKSTQVGVNTCKKGAVFVSKSIGS